MPPTEKDKIVSSSNYLTEIIALLVGLFLLGAIVNRIMDLFAGSNIGSLGDIWDVIVGVLRHNVWPFIEWFGFALSIFSVWVIVISYRGLSAIHKEERAVYHPDSTHIPPGTAAKMKNAKWEKIVELISSANQSDWRLAIIEADIMLDEMLRNKGYHGDSVGDMLKSVDKSDLLTLDAAWEAHKIRNQVVHGGDDFPLNEREAKHALALYESVFKETEII